MIKESYSRQWDVLISQFQSLFVSVVSFLHHCIFYISSDKLFPFLIICSLKTIVVLFSEKGNYSVNLILFKTISIGGSDLLPVFMLGKLRTKMKTVYASTLLKMTSHALHHMLCIPLPFLYCRT